MSTSSVSQLIILKTELLFPSLFTEVGVFEIVFRGCLFSFDVDKTCFPADSFINKYISALFPDVGTAVLGAEGTACLCNTNRCNVNFTTDGYSEYTR